MDLGQRVYWLWILSLHARRDSFLFLFSLGGDDSYYTGENGHEAHGLQQVPVLWLLGGPILAGLSSGEYHC